MTFLVLASLELYTEVSTIEIFASIVGKARLVGLLIFLIYTFYNLWCYNISNFKPLVFILFYAYIPNTYIAEVCVLILLRWNMNICYLLIALCKTLYSVFDLQFVHIVFDVISVNCFSAKQADKPCSCNKSHWQTEVSDQAGSAVEKRSVHIARRFTAGVL